MTRAARWAVRAAGVLLAAGCGGDSGGTGPGTNGGASVRVAATPQTADTVLAAPLQALVVEVRNTDGELARGAVVRFQVVPSTDPLRPYEYGMYLCPLESPACSSGGGLGYGLATFVADTTDASGRAKAAFRFGTLAGPAMVVVTVPEYALLDTLVYTVRPGSVARIVFTVPDTTLFVGARYSVGGAAADLFGNARSDAITFAGGGHVSVTSSGEVTTTSVGRGHVVATSQGYIDTAYVSVVPTGTIVAYRADPYDSSGVVTVALDGSGLRVIHYTQGDNGAVPSWMPDGRGVLFQESGPHLTVADESGVTRRLLAGSPNVLSSQQGQFSKDGAWVYFRGAGADFSSYGIWRAAADGTAAAMVAGASGAYDSQPAPSPDGARLAFNSGGELKVLTLATGAVVSLGVSGSTPRWSPDGQLIAYVSENVAGLRVIRPDGSENRVISPLGFALFLDWSPDSHWVIAHESSGLTLVRVSDGETLPLPFAAGMYQPSWKP